MTGLIQALWEGAILGEREGHPRVWVACGRFTMGKDPLHTKLCEMLGSQGVGFVTAMKPAPQILFDLVEEAHAAFEDVVGELA